MKIFYASDLHIEFEDNCKTLRFAGLDADVAILAGDIGIQLTKRRIDAIDLAG